MKTVTDGRVSILVSELCGTLFYPPFTCIGIEKDGEVIGGVVFNCYEGADIHVTVAGKGWTPGFLADVGQYVFGTLGCERLTSITEQPSIVRIAERLGGKVEGRMRNHFGKGRDGVVIGILKDEYRF